MIVRKLDDLGRIVIPKEMRELLNLKEKDPVEIDINNLTITLRKHDIERACTFCGNITNSSYIYKNKIICKKCIAQIHNLIDINIDLSKDSIGYAIKKVSETGGYIV